MPLRYSNYVASETVSSTLGSQTLAEDGVSVITASTTAPTVTLNGPTAPGTIKYILMEPNSTVSPSVVINFSTTAVLVRGTSAAATGNELTLSGFGAAVQLVSSSTTKWVMLGSQGTVSVGSQTT